MAEAKFTRSRFTVALILGLLGSLAIWVFVPFNNYLLKNNLVADSYVPVIALAFLVVIVFCVNPLLGRLKSGLRLTRRQMALTLGIWLVACIAPGTGLLGSFPYSLATACQKINSDEVLSEAHEAMDLPPVLHPDRLEEGGETPISDGLLGRIDPDEPIPWRQWLGPLRGWAPLIIGSWLMMLGLALIVYPQWRNRERLSFPLLTMYDALIESPDKNRLLPPVLRDPIFWAGAALVLVIHSCNGLASFTQGSFPGFSIEWNFWHIFQEGVLRYAPWTLRGGRIYFILIGIVYFMPNRISFSIWAGIVSTALFFMFKSAYFPMAADGHLDFKTGTWFAYGLAIFWLGRIHWVEVARAMFSGSKDDTTARDRGAGWLFVVGLAAMCGWFLWAGLSLGSSIGYVIFALFIALLTCRVVCEAGLPLLNFSPMVPQRFVSMFPLKWWSAASVYMAGFIALIFNYGARVCAGVMCCLTLGLDRERKPREQTRVAYILLVVLIVGAVIAGASHLHMAYRNEVTLDGQRAVGARPINSLGQLKQFQAGSQFLPPLPQRWRFFVFGAIVALAAQAGCMSFPRWPIHPIFFFFTGSFMGDAMWQSIFFGWLIKTLITVYGGARGYRSARPLFLGLILGEVFAVIIWSIVPVVLILTGADPADMGATSILMSR